MNTHFGDYANSRNHIFKLSSNVYLFVCFDLYRLGFWSMNKTLKLSFFFIVFIGNVTILTINWLYYKRRLLSGKLSYTFAIGLKFYWTYTWLVPHEQSLPCQWENTLDIIKRKTLHGEEINGKLCKIKKVGIQPICLNIQTKCFALLAAFIKNKVHVQL